MKSRPRPRHEHAAAAHAHQVLRDDEARTSAFKVVPAKGLTLVEVGYPPDELLAARAEQTRARRDGIDERPKTD